MDVAGWIALPEVLPWAALAFGLCVGSFLNVVAYRLPRMMEREWRAQCAELEGREPAPAPRYNLMVPRSACPSCGRGVRAHENVPVLSWLLLRGRCAGCRGRIPARYPVIEIAGGAISAYAAARYGASPAALGAMLFTWALLALALIDFDTQYLPDDLTLPLLWAGLLFNAFGTFAPLHAAVFGAVAGYLSLWLVYWAFKLATGKEGMGYGDFKLLAAIGAWLGWALLPLVILLASLAGAVIGVAMIALRRHRRDVPMPFGPYLATAGAIALFWGPGIAQRWLPAIG